MRFRLPPSPASEPESWVNEKTIQAREDVVRYQASHPEPPTLEIPVFYDQQKDGQTRFELACANKGLSWGVTNYQKIAQGNGTHLTKMLVIIGPKYEVEGIELDDCLSQLAEMLEQDGVPQT